METAVGPIIKEGLTGKIIGQLKIVSRIGKGGMGEVYLAEHMLLNRLFAVKVLSAELTADPQFSERFYHEAKNQALLQHGNIVQVTDFIKEDDRYFLVMEYVEGQNVDELIKEKGKLPEQEAVAIMKDVLSGLGFAHDKGLVHRDIKPSNIRVDTSGRAKLMDFGVAIIAGEKRMTRTGVNVGTVWYMSPEQIEHPKEIDRRSDIYSLSIVLFEMLTGMVPYDAESDFAILKQHTTAPIPDPRAMNQDISEQMSRIIMKGLAKRPEDRFQSCQEFSKALDFPAPRHHQAPWWRRRLYIGLGIALVLLLVGLYYLYGPAQKSQVEETVQPPAPVQPPPLQPPLQTPVQTPPVQTPVQQTPPVQTPEQAPQEQAKPEQEKPKEFSQAERQAFTVLIDSAFTEAAIVCREAERQRRMAEIRKLAQETNNMSEAESYSRGIDDINSNIREGLSRYNSILSQLATNPGLAEEEFKSYLNSAQVKTQPKRRAQVPLIKGHYRQYAENGDKVTLASLGEFCRAR